MGKEYNKVLIFLLVFFQIHDDFVTASCYRKVKYSSDGYKVDEKKEKLETSKTKPMTFQKQTPDFSAASKLVDLN